MHFFFNEEFNFKLTASLAFVIGIDVPAMNEECFKEALLVWDCNSFLVYLVKGTNDMLCSRIIGCKIE
jgi:hypothetical protein